MYTGLKRALGVRVDLQLDAGADPNVASYRIVQQVERVAAEHARPSVLHALQARGFTD